MPCIHVAGLRYTADVLAKLFARPKTVKHRAYKALFRLLLTKKRARIHDVASEAGIRKAEAAKAIYKLVRIGVLDRHEVT